MAEPQFLGWSPAWPVLGYLQQVFSGNVLSFLHSSLAAGCDPSLSPVFGENLRKGGLGLILPHVSMRLAVGQGCFSLIDVFVLQTYIENCENNTHYYPLLISVPVFS